MKISGEYLPLLRTSLTGVGEALDGMGVNFERVTAPSTDRVDALAERMSNLVRLCHGINKMAKVVLLFVRSIEVPDRIIDEDGTICEKLLVGAQGLAELVVSLVGLRGDIDDVVDITDEDRAFLGTCLGTVCEALSELHDSANELRSAVIDHDLEAQRASAEVFGTPEELIAHLRAA